MAVDKIFEFAFPDGIPACIKKYGQGNEPDHIDLHTFDFLAGNDECLEQGASAFPTDFDDLRSKCAETFSTILLEKLHLGYKTREYERIEKAINEIISIDISTLNSNELKKHQDQVSQLRFDAILAHNKIIKSLEYIELTSFGTQFELEIFWKNLRHAELTCRKQTKDALNLVLNLTSPTYSHVSDSETRSL